MPNSRSWLKLAEERTRCAGGVRVLMDE